MVKNKTAWALLLCVVGGIGLFLPWHDPFPVAQFWARLGTFSWHGGAVGSLLFLILLYLISTEPLNPKPAWRPVITGTAGAAGLLVFNIYAYGPGRDWAIYVGPWVTLIAVMGLLVVACLELREIFSKSRAGRE